MEKGTRRTQQQSLDLPMELIHRIQLLLSEEEAARTCVLSKSWRHAWSTIPNIRFPTHLKTTKYIKFIDNTIHRYHNHNIPIEALKFLLVVENLKSDEIWIRDRVLAPETRSYLKELCLDIWGRSLTDPRPFTFSDDILFSGDKLQRIKLRSTRCYFTISPGINPVIKCVSLRVLELTRVNISEEVFHNLLSTCSLLEKVELFCCRGLKTIKVKNLGCLRRLEITSGEVDLLEIDDVPSLGFFYYKSSYDRARENLLPFKTTGTTSSSLGRSVTHLLTMLSLNLTGFPMIRY